MTTPYATTTDVEKVWEALLKASEQDTTIIGHMRDFFTLLDKFQDQIVLLNSRIELLNLKIQMLKGETHGDGAGTSGASERPDISGADCTTGTP